MADNRRSTPHAGPPIALGIDLGGTNMNAAVIDHAGRPLADPVHAPTPVPSEPAAVLDAAAELARAACAQAGTTIERLHAVGLATPGALDPSRYTVTVAPNLGWADVTPAPMLADRLGVRSIAVENDVNAALFAEARLGAARDATDALAVWIGTGIGGAILRAGRIDVGPLGSAGEIGQVIVYTAHTQTTTLPEERWLERHASRAAIAQRIAARVQQGERCTLDNPARASATELARAYDSGDTLAIEELDRAAAIIAPAVASVCTVLGVPHVVLGGGLSEHMPGDWIDALAASITRHAHPKALRDALRVQRTALGPLAGLTGAALLAIELAETV